MFTPKIDRISYGGAMIGQEEIDAIMGVIKSQGGRRWTIGEESLLFEEELAENTGVARAVVTNSGSSALLVAMTALHLPKGSKVIIPAVNFPTAFNAILQVNCVPVVVDVDPDTLLIDINEVKKAIKEHDIKAVIAVNIAGNPVGLPKLREVVGGDTYIILDNCDGYGTKIQGDYVECFADLACVSFHAAHIITTGEGGAILGSNTELMDRCRKIREWGRASGSDKIYEYEGFPDDYRQRYVYEEIGYNMKPLELQCAMGRVQLKKINDFKRRRLMNFCRLESVFESYPQFQTMKYLDDANICWFSFPFRVKDGNRARVMDHLEGNNIECRTIFSGNVLLHPAYKNIEAIKIGDLKYANQIMRDGMFISCHPSITDEMIGFIDKCLSRL